LLHKESWGVALVLALFLASCGGKSPASFTAVGLATFITVIIIMEAAISILPAGEETEGSAKLKTFAQWFGSQFKETKN